MSSRQFERAVLDLGSAVLERREPNVRKATEDIIERHDYELGVMLVVGALAGLVVGIGGAVVVALLIP